MKLAQIRIKVALAERNIDVMDAS
jgi:hypothetical protein